MNSHIKALSIVKRLTDKKLAKNMQRQIDNQIKNWNIQSQQNKS